MREFSPELVTSNLKKAQGDHVSQVQIDFKNRDLKQQRNYQNIPNLEASRIESEKAVVDN